MAYFFVKIFSSLGGKNETWFINIEMASSTLQL